MAHRGMSGGRAVRGSDRGGDRCPRWPERRGDRDWPWLVRCRAHVVGGNHSPVVVGGGLDGADVLPTRRAGWGTVQLDELNATWIDLLADRVLLLILLPVGVAERGVLQRVETAGEDIDVAVQLLQPPLDDQQRGRADVHPLLLVEGGVDDDV